MSDTDTLKTPLREALGKEYDRLRAAGERAHLYAVPMMAMTPDDLCAAIGWILESNNWWREFSTRERKI